MSKKPKYPKSLIIDILKKRYSDSKGLDSSSLSADDASLYNACYNMFGSLRKAIIAAGLDPSIILKRRKWTKDDIITELKKIPHEDLFDVNLKKNHYGLWTAIMRLFGSRRAALNVAGLINDSLISKPWTKETIESEIQRLHFEGQPLNFKFIHKHHSRLLKRAKFFFGSWGGAVQAAGFDYNHIMKNKGWAKPSLSCDGRIYCSQLECLVANKLFELKNRNIILDYKPQSIVTNHRDWTCDFVVLLTSGSKLWVEADGLGKKRKKSEQFFEKLTFYKEMGYIYCVVTDPDQIESSICEATEDSTIPKKDSIITAHICPDGDALSSIVAMYRHMINIGVKSAIIIKGDVPENLLWIIEGVEKLDEFPEWAEQVIVLDSGFSYERIGWNIPNGINIVNIDHHISRLSKHDPKNKIFIYDMCSTASVLLWKFGIKDDILAIGMYTDTLLSRRMKEVFNSIIELGISEEKFRRLLDSINNLPMELVWRVIRNSKVSRLPNGFVIVETDEDSLVIIDYAIHILNKLNPYICLIYGKIEKRTVKLRVPEHSQCDVSKVAKIFNGGGHRFAAVCPLVDGNIDALKKELELLEFIDNTDKQKDKKICEERGI